MKKIIWALSVFSTGVFGATDSVGGFYGEGEKSKVPFKNGKETFEKLKEQLLKGHQDDRLSEDDLYRAATAGMLRFANESPWDGLLSPEEFRELKVDLDGALGGVGLEMKFEEDSGIADVLAVIPGGAGEKAGLKAGDKILKVNGQFYKGKTMRDLIYAIRGTPGTGVEVSLLRGDRVFSKKLVREKITWAPLQSLKMSPQTAYLGIGYFTRATTTLATQALEKFQREGVKQNLILDLRGNSGGALDPMIEFSRLLLKKDQLLATTIHRGNKTEKIVATNPNPYVFANILILINAETSSGAEVLAQSLRENLGARLVGQKSKGKWSAQRLESLPNGYAIKYTVSVFKSPKGESFEGRGIEPDVTVDMDEGNFDRSKRQSEIGARLASDVQLKTAWSMLK